MKHIELQNPTAQEVVDAAFAYLATMKSKCMKGDFCVYRNKENTSACAVGAFIPDGHPALKSPSGVTLMLEVNYPASSETPLPAWMYEHVQLLSVLQSVHDSQRVPVEWFEHHGLAVPTVITGLLAKD